MANKKNEYKEEGERILMMDNDALETGTPSLKNNHNTRKTERHWPKYSVWFLTAHLLYTFVKFTYIPQDTVYTLTNLLYTCPC